MNTLPMLHTADWHPGGVDDTALVMIPGGVFWMGSAGEDPLALERERPRHAVRVSAFQCMRYQVTRRLWVEVMGGAYRGERLAPVDDRPVWSASWYEAAWFCNQLSARVGLAPCYRFEGGEVHWVSSAGYRLPTEAEWERACRADMQARWCCGEDAGLIDACAWHAGCQVQAPQPVGRLHGNAWGLHDMHGNVWEWCWDWYAAYPARDPDTPLVDPRGPERGHFRVLRGGSFARGAITLRCAARHWGKPAYRFRFRGLRCVRGSG